MVAQTFTDLRDLAALGFDPHFIRMGCVEVDLNNNNDDDDIATTMSGNLDNVLHFDRWSSTFASGDASPCAFNNFVVREQFARDGVVSPTDLAACYLNAAKSINTSLEVMFDSNVVAIDACEPTRGSSTAILTMSDGSIVEAGSVINAAGAWVDELGVVAGRNAGEDNEGRCVPVGLMRADYWLLKAPRPIPKDTPLLTLPGAYIKPHGNQVELGTYRDQQLVYEHPDDYHDEDVDMVAIMN
jgi:glycine/D-amino acid oxidase-like deaminating enzyme